MTTIQATARRAGALYLLFLLVGLVGMYAFPSFLVAGDAAATARALAAHELAFRLGILNDALALILFLILVVSLHRLLRPVDAWHAGLMTVFVAVGVGVGFANLLLRLAPLVLLRGGDDLRVFGPGQIEATVLGLLELNREGDAVAALFWGLWLFPFGILVNRSRFLPRLLGVLLLVAGSAYVTSAVSSIAWPAGRHLVARLTLPFLLGEFPIIFWLFFKGANGRNQ